MYAKKGIAIKPEKKFEALDGIWTRDLQAARVMLWPTKLNYKFEYSVNEYMVNYIHVSELRKWNQMKKMIFAVMYAIKEISINLLF